MNPFFFTNDRARRAEQILREAPQRRAALLPLLWLAQEQEGWVTPEARAAVAALAGLAEAEALEVLSFHTMLRQVPPARFRIEVCVGICCAQKGARALLAALEARLGIRAGEATADGRLSLATVECIGGCDSAPAVRVNDELHEGADEASLDALVQNVGGGA